MADDLMEEEQAEMPVEEQAEPPAHDAAEGEPAAKPAANPKSQEAAQKLIAAAGRIVYQKKVTAMILKTIEKAPRPEAGIAQAVLMVMKQVKDMAKGVPPQVIDKMAKPITMMVMELAVNSGLIEDKPEIVKMVVGLIQQAIAKVKAGPQKGTQGPNMGPQIPNQGMPPQGMPPQGLIQQQMGA